MSRISFNRTNQRRLWKWSWTPSFGSYAVIRTSVWLSTWCHLLTRRDLPLGKIQRQNPRTVMSRAIIHALHLVIFQSVRALPYSHCLPSLLTQRVVRHIEAPPRLIHISFVTDILHVGNNTSDDTAQKNNLFSNDIIALKTSKAVIKGNDSRGGSKMNNMILSEEALKLVISAKVFWDRDWLLGA